MGGAMSLKARDVTGHLKAHGYEKGAELMFQVLAEEQAAIREAMANLAEMMDQLSNIIVDVTSVTTQHQTAISKFKQTMGEDEAQPTTRDGH
jgi:hypothetical protein